LLYYTQCIGYRLEIRRKAKKRHYTSDISCFADLCTPTESRLNSTNTLFFDPFNASWCLDSVNQMWSICLNHSTFGQEKAASWNLLFLTNYKLPTVLYANSSVQLTNVNGTSPHKNEKHKSQGSVYILVKNDSFSD